MCVKVAHGSFNRPPTESHTKQLHEIAKAISQYSEEITKSRPSMQSSDESLRGWYDAYRRT